MRLTPPEERTVEQMTHQNIKPRDILAAIKEQNPHNVSTRNTIYNARAKLGRMEQVGETPLQIFSTGWRRLDSTYKTNRYKMPLVQIIGVTSALMSFCIAHAFVSNEKQENFTWVLQRLKHSLDSVMEPRVIVTDRDRALMNACATVFPKARHSLCRWHIQQNIFKHCRQSFQTDDSWSRFLYKLGELINSTTDHDYNYWYKRIRSRLPRKKNDGQMIPLELIDPFWRKLNLDPILKPSKVDSFDLDGEFVLLKLHLSAKPREVKKNLLQKMKDLLQLNKTKLKQPVVQKNTRGHPTLKAQEQRKDDSFTEPSRHSLFTTQGEHSDSPVGLGTQESIIEPSRHNSFVESQSYCAETAMFFGEIANGAKDSKTKKKVAKSKEEQPDLPLLPVGLVNMFMHFKKFIPPCFYQHLSHIQNVQGDGNCGFRSIAVGLSLKEWDWSFIRAQLHDDCNRFHELWKMINGPGYQNVLDSLDWTGISGAPEHKWLQMPFTGLLIANQWNVVCLLLSDLGCASFFPMFRTAEESIPHRTAVLVHVNTNHFIHVRLEGEYPMPTPSGYWRHATRNTPAESWYHYYRERIDQYNRIVDEYRTRDYVDLGTL
ncbi:uncharacterized protein LOC110876856 [Helianthus annuus]|uniref:uncharacterized protein LOC110876856 n=1 Tax=Helianthus annuus TaxID=4232 RepID=UPI000B8EEDEC|nr:uncharacterized protein LOC110876856 [Helianthus annuus]